MKRSLFLSTLFLLFSMFCTAQTSEAFSEKCTALETRLAALLEAKDYSAAERCQKEMIRLLEVQPQEVQTQYNFLKSGNYYNLACIQSLSGKRNAAVKSFVAACENGYDDYGHTVQDTDLDNIRTDKTFMKLHEAMRETSDYLHILQTAPRYACNECPDTLPKFTYMAPNNRDLVRVREYFKLDSVAGSGDELSKIKRILTYVHNTIRHDGQHGNPQPMDAISLAEACKDGSRGLNCRGLATVLNECYLSMGFKSRFVTCMPKVYISDCHVINAVYSATLDKWVWVDPTDNAWVTDENGVMLGLGEVREHLRDGRPLILNEEANWNNKKKIVKAQYLENYMAKNLYCLICPAQSQFATEVQADGKVPASYIGLIPEGFQPQYPGQSKKTCFITDADLFWQSPYNE